MVHKLASEHAVPTAYFAHFGNFHFWALERDAEPQALQNPTKDVRAFGDLLLPVVGAAEALDVGEAGEEQGVRASSTASVNRTLSADLFGLAAAVMQWDPFGHQQAGLGAMAKALESGTEGAISHVFDVLQWRDALKLAQWERLDQEVGLDREVHVT